LLKNLRRSPRAVGAALLLVAALSAGVFIEATRWPAGVVLLKATGQIKGLDWADVAYALRAGFDMESLVKTRSAYQAITNPHTSETDIAAGRNALAANCAGCHGPDAAGAAAPSLVGRQLSVGGSDWAIFRTITHGIPANGMPALDLPAKTRWQIIAYLHSISADTAPEPAALKVPSVSAEDIVNARKSPQNWLTYSGAYDGWRHSALNQINRSNVAQLRLLWIYQVPDAGQRFETTPLVVDGVMYITTSKNGVAAIDAATGKELWTYSRTLPVPMLLCCGRVNRGVAILGDTLFLATLDAHLIALDATTGAVRWDVVVADYLKGYSLTSAPLAVKDMVLIGTAGGEFPSRGSIDSYDATTGARRWRFNTIPGPGDPGSETWGKNSWRNGGGPAWLTGSYDPGLDLVYWGVGNPNPDFNGAARPGDNLYTNSFVALEPETGKLRWAFQFTPHDEHDWDAAQVPVLIDDAESGRRLVLNANKNGFFYALDRETGGFVGGWPFVKQTWAKGLDENGRPIPAPDAAPSAAGTLTWPGSAGATNWWSPSYSPQAKLFYVTASLRGDVFIKGNGDAHLTAMAGSAQEREGGAAIIALDPRTGERRWQKTLVEKIPAYPYFIGGVLSVGGGLVFSGAEDTLFAFDDANGETLWRFQTGKGVHSAPISYMAGGRQLISIAAGQTILTFGVDEK
jgi:alcohol dehydrogenase (cytochrome c)